MDEKVHSADIGKMGKSPGEDKAPVDYGRDFCWSLCCSIYWWITWKRQWTVKWSSCWWYLGIQGSQTET